MKCFKLLLLISFTFIIPGKSHAQDVINRNMAVAKINGYGIVYDNYHRGDADKKIIVYAKNAKAKTLLLKFEADDEYSIDSVTVKCFLNQPFIYISTTDRHGDVVGSLFALDLAHLKTYGLQRLTGSLPKSKDPADERRNYYELKIEGSKILDGGNYRNDKGNNYEIDYELQVIKLAENKYGLKPIKRTVVKGD